jgi:hypothetical protein
VSSSCVPTSKAFMPHLALPRPSPELPPEPYRERHGGITLRPKSSIRRENRLPELRCHPLQGFGAGANTALDLGDFQFIEKDLEGRAGRQVKKLS